MTLVLTLPAGKTVCTRYFGSEAYHLVEYH